jgi:hypothetical protein
VTKKKGLETLTTPGTDFKKHFTDVTYDGSKISWRILKTQHGSMNSMDSPAYSPWVVSYMGTMFMKWTTRDNIIKLFTAVSYAFS